MALDGTTSVESTGHVAVPAEDYQPTGCNGFALAPQPVVLADDFTALDAATAHASADSAPKTSVSVVIGHYASENPFTEVEVKGEHELRQNYVADFSFQPTDPAAQAALKDLLSSIKDAR